MVEDGGGRELGDAGKVLVLQVVSGVHAAAGQKGVLDAGGQKVPKTDFQIQAVQFFQKTARCIVSQIMQTVPVNFVDGTAGLFHELIAEVRFLGRAVLPLQRLRDSSVFFPAHLPQIRRFCAPDGPGVRQIVDIPQPGIAPRVLVNKSDAR